MDPRRLLKSTPALAAAALLIAGCAAWSSEAELWPAAGAALEPAAALDHPDAAAEGAPLVPAASADSDTAVPYLPASKSEVAEGSSSGAPVSVGRAAIAVANQAARAPSRGDSFVGGMQIFAWSPGRVFEIWAAPLRVTTLTLGEGETLVSKAAGDTVRWQIGETQSGAGAMERTHVLLKPLERGLETNLVLTTNHRVYLLHLKSGSAEAFNAAIGWEYAADAADHGTKAEAEDRSSIDPSLTPQGPIDADYRIEPRGRRPRWTPSSVFNDGVRTFILFGADLQVDEAPALFVLSPGGEAQIVNYRQQGGLFIVDRVFDRAELRLGDRRPQIVRIRRLTEAVR